MLGRSITGSKLQFQPVLHDARIHAHCVDFSERARTRDITRGIGKIGVIKDVEELPAENYAGLLPEFCALDESHVKASLIRPSQDIPSQISEDRPATSNWILSVDQAPVRNERGRNKYAGVEELIYSAADAPAPKRVF